MKKFFSFFTVALMALFLVSCSCMGAKSSMACCKEKKECCNEGKECCKTKADGSCPVPQKKS